jgi:hypothetical protein
VASAREAPSCRKSWGTVALACEPTPRIRPHSTLNVVLAFAFTSEPIAGRVRLGVRVVQ